MKGSYRSAYESIADAPVSGDLTVFDGAPLCTRCEASFARQDDTLCAECRSEIDGAFCELPGAEE